MVEAGIPKPAFCCPVADVFINADEGAGTLSGIVVIPLELDTAPELDPEPEPEGAELGPPETVEAETVPDLARRVAAADAAAAVTYTPDPFPFPFVFAFPFPTVADEDEEVAFDEEEDEDEKAEIAIGVVDKLDEAPSFEEEGEEEVGTTADHENKLNQVGKKKEMKGME